MNLGLRSILLIVAIVLFIIAAVSDTPGDLLPFGLAAFAAAFLVGDLPVNNRRN